MNSGTEKLKENNVSRAVVLQQRREFLVSQYEQYRDMFDRSRDLLDKVHAEQRLNCLYNDIREVDNLLLKEAIK